MEFSRLITIVGEEPLFEAGLLLAGEVEPNDVRRQISRWVKVGQLYQLRRGLYALAPPFQKVKPIPSSSPTASPPLPMSACNRPWHTTDSSRKGCPW